jgi:hypothetical protein
VVQQLLAARRDLSLPRALRALDVFDAVILDDLGYVQQSAEEAEVLFTLMAERYERRSLIITSNLIGSPALLLKASAKPARHFLGSAGKSVEEVGCYPVVCSKSAGEPE